MNKHDLIQKVKALDGISQDERAYLIDLINTKKKYGLVWEDKPEDVEETLRTHLPVLQEVVEKRIIAPNSPLTPNGGISFDTSKKTTSQPTLFDSPPTPEGGVVNNEQKAPFGGLGAVGLAANHTLIEGDNLHALTALTFTHENNIDVIYIDPPYNTGNKDFKYNDSFVDREDSYRHSKWLSFMDKRLRIAKRLLSDKGVIFISIDDNEQAQLKLLCDEVFGEVNGLASIVWQSKKGGGSDNNFLVVEHEYVFVFSKDKTKCNLNKIEMEAEPLDKIDEKGSYRVGRELNKWGANSLRQDRPTMWFPIPGPNGEDVFPIRNDGKEGCWRWGKPMMMKAALGGDIEFIMREKGTYTAYEKIRSTEIRLKPHRTFLGEIGTTADGSKIVRDIFLGDKAFQFAKPLTLISHLLNLSHSKDSTILDFFAGSGTTLHATMALNAEDGGRRQCILVTNNENNICEEVTYERNKRVIEGYTNAKGVWVEGLLGNHLRYYKTATVEREPSLRNKRQLTRLATELLCIKEDCYTPRATTDTALQAFEEKAKRLLLVYDDAMIDEALAYLKTWLSESPAESPIKVYVFSNGQYPYTEDFEEVLPHITLCALPDAIYKAYQYVLPKREKTKPEQDLGMGQDGQDFLQD